MRIIRIIPARAGFTRDACCQRGADAGSSPLARGLLDSKMTELNKMRIIPARAGFTGTGTSRVLKGWDHPRSRGVYVEGDDVSEPRSGSSPLARGLQFQPRAEELQGRIIPARAGFTRTGRSTARARTDHPRSRGVYSSPESAEAAMAGSSPLARGLPRRVQEGTTQRGIIPARAGFTSRSGQLTVTGTIIPARAGFTRCGPRSEWTRCDHPRSRGVYWCPVYRVSPASRSSPLARGLPQGGTSLLAFEPIIPARAGFTLADPWNPNDEPHYQTTFAFTADLVLAPQSSDSAVVSQRSTRTPSEA